MKHLTWLCLSLTLVACAHGKMGKIDKALPKGVINKSTPLTVETISAKNVEFSGDKSGERQRTEEERAAIEKQYNRKIVEALRRLGYNAKASDTPVKAGLVVTGKVTKFEHGSAAARIMVGMGAGSSNIFTDVRIEDRSQNKVISDFQVIATSGGRGGLYAAGSFMDAHLNDGAEKIAEYIDKNK